MRSSSREASSDALALQTRLLSRPPNVQSAPHLLPVRHTPLRALQLFGGRSLLLFDQVVLDAADFFCGIEDLRPRRSTFPEDRRVAGRRRPVFAVNALDPAGILVD